jgi:hypothetical protein
VGLGQISTGYGLMVVVCNSKVKYLGISLINTFILLVDAFVCGVSLVLAMEKVYTMELV